uniref:Short-chain dehydrogenase/reductase family 9C member 7 n=1 Tax=Ascaris suum TaxID=6253 RepID=F1LAA7_ASCSU
MVCCFFAFVVVFLLLPLYYALRYLWELLPVGNLRKKAVFITGCDSGFGRTLAIKCAENGMHVFAGCLTEQGAKSIEADGRSMKGIKKAVDFVKKRLEPGISLWAVVNNAGIFATYGPDDWCSIEDYKLALDINTSPRIAGVRMVQLYSVKQQSKGRIISVTSVAGRVSLPYTGPYSVGKFASEAYMDCIRYELKPFGVTCCILEPGVFKTTLVNRDAMKKRINGAWNKLTEEQREDYGVAFKDSFCCTLERSFQRSEFGACRVCGRQLLSRDNSAFSTLSLSLRLGCVVVLHTDYIFSDRDCRFSHEISLRSKNEASCS